MQMLTHNITKSSIDTKTAQWINSYFINGASQKHSNYIFENKSSFFIIKSGVKIEIWTLLLFMASFDLSNLGGWMESNFSVDFDVGKSKDFGIFLSESINFEYLRHKAKFKNWL